MKPLFYGRRLPGCSRSYLVVNYIPMLKIVNSSESLPAVPDATVIERFSDLPQRTDYVPPIISPGLLSVTAGLTMALAIHKFLEVNAVMSEHRELADRLRDILEGER